LPLLSTFVPLSPLSLFRASTKDAGSIGAKFHEHHFWNVPTDSGNQTAFWFQQKLYRQKNEINFEKPLKKFTLVSKYYLHLTKSLPK